MHYRLFGPSKKYMCVTQRSNCCHNIYIATYGIVVSTIFCQVFYHLLSRPTICRHTDGVPWTFGDNSLGGGAVLKGLGVSWIFLSFVELGFFPNTERPRDRKIMSVVVLNSLIGRISLPPKSIQMGYNPVTPSPHTTPFRRPGAAAGAGECGDQQPSPAGRGGPLGGLRRRHRGGRQPHPPPRR